jgi:signal transduction histidine kinase
MRPERWMRLAGLGTWVVAAVPTALAIARGDVDASRAVGFAVAALAFVAAFSACPARRGAALGALVAQSLAAIAMVWLGNDLTSAAMFVVVATQLPEVVPGGVAAAWIAAQSASIAVRFDGRGPALATAAAFAGFQAFALAAASLVASERRARAAAAEHGRAVERLRVARDLHDTLGHHLTALAMQLEVAARLADGRAKEHVERAHAIGRLLLADVRDAVSDLRDPRPLGAALRSLVAAPGPLTVHLELADELAGLAGEPADAIARCVQEAMTNTARHGNAANLWIAVTAERATIRVRVRDDGNNAAPTFVWGHGLTGMRERFVALGGGVDARRTPDGFDVEATLPRRPA